MDQQQLLATLIQLSDEQQHRIAELLNRLEGQAQTLARASQQAEHDGKTRNGNLRTLKRQPPRLGPEGCSDRRGWRTR